MNTDVVERYDYKGYSILVERDSDPMNPRKEFDNAGTMICAHDRYDLGDVKGLKSSEDLLSHMGQQCSGWDALLERQEKRAAASLISYDNLEYWRQFERDCHEEKMSLIQKHLIVLSCFLYDHGGITMNCHGFSCGWDSGQVGFIYITRKQAVEEWGKKICSKKVVERATKYLEGEVETYDQYLTGQVYGRRVLKPANPALVEALGDIRDVDDDDREEIDSCWGYFGYEETQEDSELVAEGKNIVDWDIENQPKKELENLVNAVMQ